MINRGGVCFVSGVSALHTVSDSLRKVERGEPHSSNYRSAANQFAAFNDKNPKRTNHVASSMSIKDMPRVPQADHDYSTCASKHTSTCATIRQRVPTYVSTRHRMSACVCACFYTKI